VAGPSAKARLEAHVAQHGMENIPAALLAGVQAHHRATAVLTNAHGDIDVTYVDAGPLGVVWRAAREAEAAGAGLGAFVKSVRSGSVSSGVPHLQVGMQLRRVAGEAVAGKAYEEVRWTSARPSLPTAPRAMH
jgi:hypothetical protein